MAQDTDNDLNPTEIESREIALLGEYTTSEGPFIDDHFLVVITTTGEISEIALDGPGSSSLLANLTEKLGSDLSLRLCNRADFSSAVIFPKQFLNEPLFVEKSADEDLSELDSERFFRSPDLDPWKLNQGLIDAVLSRG